MRISKYSPLVVVLRWICRLAVLLLVLDILFVLVFPAKRAPDIGSPADAVVVLGAAPNSPAIRSRADTGMAAYRAGWGKALVLTGGVTSVKDESEAMNMARYLTKNQPTRLPILLEDKSTNTYENLQFSKELLGEPKSVVVVSDRYHLPRAFLVAKSLGFESVYWASPSSSYYRPAELAWYYIREMVAVLAYVPKFLGR